ncbi:Cif family virulence factor [Chitinophaga deserti]|uniref:hypothetical protein n=1 Tax=Chitinophaga deserti TaxID=2164099 RepID=UPI000D6AAF74|nr:hypothetical protein [Chitinophaga deserti]
MRTPYFLIVYLLLPGMFRPALAQQDVKALLYSAGQQLDDAFQHSRQGKLLTYYSPQVVVMPEFHNILYGHKNTGSYYAHWLNRTTFNQLNRKIVDVQSAGQNAIEAGNYQHRFVKTGSDTATYSAKYLRVWDLGDKKAPQIIVEVWGSVNWFERSILPQIPDFPSAPPPSAADNETVSQITERNTLIKRFVTARDGVSHAKLFAQDAIYMPYYENMHIGIDSVHAYFVRHERPDNLTIDSLQILHANMIELGNGIVLENGFYKVRWHTADDPAGGTGSGKSVNVWKKNKRGEWMMFRQMVNHD